MTNTTAPPGTRRGDMTASAFLSEMWRGPQVPGLITTWELARKRTYYWPTTHVGEFHDQAPDVFFGVGSTREDRGKGRRPRVNEICALAGVFLDIDGVSVGCDADTRAWVARYLPTPPTMIVDSGHGIHAYHLFTEGPWIFRTLAERDSAIDLLTRWVRLHPAADQSVHDIARVMRLPGTVNNKDPLDPRVVRVISHGGPRHRVADLLDLVRDIQLLPTNGVTVDGRPALDDLAGDTSSFVAKLDALLDLSPEFERRWAHTEAPADNSLSAYDLSLCTLAAGAMTNAELAKLIDMHRCQWGTGDDIIKGHRDTYLRQTIGKARANANRDSAMRELER